MSSPLSIFSPLSNFSADLSSALTHIERPIPRRSGQINTPIPKRCQTPIQSPLNLTHEPPPKKTKTFPDKPSVESSPKAAKPLTER